MKNMRKMLLTVATVAVAAVGARAQAIQAPAGLAYTIANNAPATAVTPVTYQWYRNNSPIQGATEASYTVPAAAAYGDNVTFYRMAKARECAGEAEKPSNTITITFFGYVVPAGCNLVIGGICWANANLTAYQVIGTQPDVYTVFFQWNRATTPYSSALDPLTSAWNATPDEATGWSNGDPCPQDWRLPTKDEYQLLHDAGNTWVDAGTRGASLAGRFYGYNHTTCTLPSNMNGCVFFPASGFRLFSAGGAPGSPGTYGYGWSSTSMNNANGYTLAFSNSFNHPADNNHKANAYPIRCVR